MKKYVVSVAFDNDVEAKRFEGSVRGRGEVAYTMNDGTWLYSRAQIVESSGTSSRQERR